MEVGRVCPSAPWIRTCYDSVARWARRATHMVGFRGAMCERGVAGTCIERVETALEDLDLFSEDLRADAGINSLRGVGVSEAPRGTLFHDYTVDHEGLLKRVNLIVATGQNNLAMNQTVAQIARHYVQAQQQDNSSLNLVLPALMPGRFWEQN